MKVLHFNACSKITQVVQKWMQNRTFFSRPARRQNGQGDAHSLRRTIASKSLRKHCARVELGHSTAYEFPLEVRATIAHQCVANDDALDHSCITLLTDTRHDAAICRKPGRRLSKRHFLNAQCGQCRLYVVQLTAAHAVKHYCPL